MHPASLGQYERPIALGDHLERHIYVEIGTGNRRKEARKQARGIRDHPLSHTEDPLFRPRLFDKWMNSGGKLAVVKIECASGETIQRRAGRIEVVKKPAQRATLPASGSLAPTDAAGGDAALAPAGDVRSSDSNASAVEMLASPTPSRRAKRNLAKRNLEDSEATDFRYFQFSIEANSDEESRRDGRRGRCGPITVYYVHVHRRRRTPALRPAAKRPASKRPGTVLYSNATCPH